MLLAEEAERERHADLRPLAELLARLTEIAS